MATVKMPSSARSAILHLAGKHVLDSRQAQEALVRAGVIPDRALWTRALGTFLLSCGAAFFLSGTVFFFAFNWHALHKFAKLGSIAAVLAASVATGFILGRERPGGRLAWMAASVMTGVFLAVFGQVYQTGADAWQLFALWAALITGWTVVSLYPPQWTLFLVIAEIAAVLALIQSGSRYDNEFRAMVLLAALNGAAFAAFETARLLGVKWLETRWFTRLLAAGAVAAFIVPVSLYILEPSDLREKDFFTGCALILFIAFSAVLAALLRKSKDLFVLAVAIFSLVVYGTDIYYKLVIKDISFKNFFPWLSIGLVIVGLAAGAVFTIRKIGGRWSRESAHEND